MVTVFHPPVYLCRGQTNSSLSTSPLHLSSALFLSTFSLHLLSTFPQHFSSALVAFGVSTFPQHFLGTFPLLSLSICCTLCQHFSSAFVALCVSTLPLHLLHLLALFLLHYLFPPCSLSFPSLQATPLSHTAVCHTDSYSGCVGSVPRYCWSSCSEGRLSLFPHVLPDMGGSCEASPPSIAAPMHRHMFVCCTNWVLGRSLGLPSCLTWHTNCGLFGPACFLAMAGRSCSPIGM